LAEAERLNCDGCCCIDSEVEDLAILGGIEVPVAAVVSDDSDGAEAEMSEAREARATLILGTHCLRGPAGESGDGRVENWGGMAWW
jgi:hypothetical protein